MHERGCESVGIDLGTTYSSLAYIDQQMTPRIVPDSSGQTVIPSVIFFDDNEVIVGDIALQQAKLRAEQVVQFIKVHMGDDWHRELGGRSHTPESLSAMILAHLVRESEPQIGGITSAVITVPAYFTEKRRRATQQAGEIAGLKVIGILNEPTAAALAYGLSRENKRQNVLVYDLGGGTFDVTVIRIEPGSLEELATCGNRQLGGKDWDQALIDYVAEDFKRRFGGDPRGQPQAWQDLVLATEQAKRQLTRLAKTSVRLHALGHDHVCEITRETFEGITAHLLRTTKLTTEMALEDAALDWKHLDRVVLVGGSTHMPMVRSMLKQLSGKDPETGVNPVLAVALGAAIYAQMLETDNAPKAVQHVKLLEKARGADGASTERQEPAAAQALPIVDFVTAHGVGVKVRHKEKMINFVLIKKNTRVPCEVSREFRTFAAGPNTRRLTIEVTQGDTNDLELAELLGTGVIEGLPANEPPGQPVRVTMLFDKQGRLHVRARYVKTGQELEFVLQVAGGLEQEQVEEFRQLFVETGLTRSRQEAPPNGNSPLDDVPLLEGLDDDDDDDIPLLEPIG